MVNKSLQRLTLVSALISLFGFTNVGLAAEAYFKVRYPPAPEEFVIKLISPSWIEHARQILAGEKKDKIHVMGTIVKKSARYNPPWSFHLAPESINFFAYSIEVCDSSIALVQENLDKVGGAFLPKNHWCPWGSILVEELPDISPK